MLFVVFCSTPASVSVSRRQLPGASYTAKFALEHGTRKTTLRALTRSASSKQRLQSCPSLAPSVATHRRCSSLGGALAAHRHRKIKLTVRFPLLTELRYDFYH
jgi:hypothetical protein